MALIALRVCVHYDEHSGDHIHRTAYYTTQSAGLKVYSFSKIRLNAEHSEEHTLRGLISGTFREDSKILQDLREDPDWMI